jgi:hypothetical protein
MFAFGQCSFRGPPVARVAHYPNYRRLAAPSAAAQCAVCFAAVCIWRGCKADVATAHRPRAHDRGRRIARPGCRRGNAHVRRRYPGKARRDIRRSPYNFGPGRDRRRIHANRARAKNHGETPYFRPSFITIGSNKPDGCARGFSGSSSRAASYVHNQGGMSCYVCK